jgi:hypothetical protein
LFFSSGDKCFEIEAAQATIQHSDDLQGTPKTEFPFDSQREKLKRLKRSKVPGQPRQLDAAGFLADPCSRLFQNVRPDTDFFGKPLQSLFILLNADKDRRSELAERLVVVPSLHRLQEVDGKSCTCFMVV